jgi:hypothetical protein
MGLTQIELQVFHAQIAQAKAVSEIANALNEIVVLLQYIGDELGSANTRLDETQEKAKRLGMVFGSPEPAFTTAMDD